MSEHAIPTTSPTAEASPLTRRLRLSPDTVRAAAIAIPAMPLPLGWAAGLPIAFSLVLLFPACLIGFYAGIRAATHRSEDRALPLYPIVLLTLSVIVYQLAQYITAVSPTAG